MGWHLSELIAQYGVPGAQIAVLAGGEIRDEAAGVLSLHTRVETTTDSVLKIGSITKIWTATLVQQLVNDGMLVVRAREPGASLALIGVMFALSGRAACSARSWRRGCSAGTAPVEWSSRSAGCGAQKSAFSRRCPTPSASASLPESAHLPLCLQRAAGDGRVR